jgi:hypothetical protein
VGEAKRLGFIDNLIILIYAFGVIMWEVAARRLPYSGVNTAVVSVCIPMENVNSSLKKCSVQKGLWNLYNSVGMVTLRSDHLLTM